MYALLAWRNLWRNKRRTAITLAAIVFAVLFATVMRSMQLGSYDNMIDNTVRYYTGFAQIHKKGYWNEQSLENSMVIDSALIRQALQSSSVSDLIPRLESFALASNGMRTMGIMVTGIEPEKERLLTHLDTKIIQGQYLDSTDRTILLTEKLAEYLQAGIGDTVILIGAGYRGANAAGKYAVKGIVSFNNPELNKRSAFLTRKEASLLYDVGERITTLVVVTEPELLAEAIRHLKQVFPEDSYELMQWQEMLPELVQAIEVDNIGGIIILFILYTVIGFGIFGTIVMMTAERQHEFGVLIALGMKRRRLLALIGLENIFLVTTGVLGGMVLSLPLVTYFHFNPIPLSDELKLVSESYGIEAIIPFALDSEIFLYQAAAVLVISSFAMIYPLGKILTLNPGEAMRA
ncbi:MAG: ABC transporter substrate-binding protein [Chitinophagales bacterium]|nr:MAG: ABC transporter substrate-binding protein [Chitinophagales bacterium]